MAVTVQVRSGAPDNQADRKVHESEPFVFLKNLHKICTWNSSRDVKELLLNKINEIKIDLQIAFMGLIECLP